MHLVYNYIKLVYSGRSNSTIISNWSIVVGQIMKVVKIPQNTYISILKGNDLIQKMYVDILRVIYIG
jgi:hypothetical protein